MFVLILFSTFVCYSVSIEDCRRIKVESLGPPDGIYESIVDYRGRPDFLREDRLYNLFGDTDNNGTMFWELDSTLVHYPYYTSEDESYHPLDVKSSWYIHYRDGNSTEVYPKFECTNDKSKNGIIFVVMVSIASLASVLLLVWFHVFIRRRRLRREAIACPVCKRRAKDVNNTVVRRRTL